jgi:hypothetical protein
MRRRQIPTAGSVQAAKTLNPKIQIGIFYSNIPHKLIDKAELRHSSLELQEENSIKLLHFG